MTEDEIKDMTEKFLEAGGRVTKVPSGESANKLYGINIGNSKIPVIRFVGQTKHHGRGDNPNSQNHFLFKHDAEKKP